MGRAASFWSQAGHFDCGMFNELRTNDIFGEGQWHSGINRTNSDNELIQTRKSSSAKSAGRECSERASWFGDTTRSEKATETTLVN